MNYPQQPNPGQPGQQGQVPPGYGPPPQPYTGQPYPPQSQAPQGFPSPQQQPQQGWGAPQQAWGQPGGMPQQQWGQQPGMPPQAPPPGKGWKSPLVLIGGAVVLVIVIVGGIVVALNSGGSDSNSAQATTTSAAASTSKTTSAPSSSTKAPKSTTAGAKAGAVPAAVQPIVDALPAALKTAVLKNDVRQKPGDDYRGEANQAGMTISAHDSLTQGLMHWPDNEYYPLASITTKPDVILHIWQSQHPDWLTDEGSRKVRIDPGSSLSNGSATLEVFVPKSNLYITLSGFSSVDAAKQFVQRAGF
ncbi:hypothetical protein AB0N05_17700 [Nocardia sp. NPDC051030]|uniref:hypothetical protein n=1 Tax=Nocardia sp. NPDC051030 TaxID=3155162 RepID=UPI003421C132